MKPTEEELRNAAARVVALWNKWADVEGWDNNEYDDFSDALQDLENLLKRK